MVQKLINLLALIAFVGMASIAGAGYYVFLNKDSIIKDLIPIPELPGLDGDLPLPGAPGGEGVSEIPVTMPSF